MGHRQRLREKFLKVGREGLAEYELLEMVLFSAIPRGDVKPLAKQLLAHFGSYAGVIRAPLHELRAVKGVGEGVIAALKIIEASSLHLIRADMIAKPVLRNWDNVVAYCRATMGFAKEEALRVLYLNARNEVMHEEVQQQGTVNQTAIYPREVVKRALEVGAAAVILVHNHPSGDATPSTADVELTRHVNQALATVGIGLHDHLIITRNDHSSLKALGLY